MILFVAVMALFADDLRDLLIAIRKGDDASVQMLLRAGADVNSSHYNRGRPPSALGPGLPEPTSERVPPNPHRHSLPVGYRMVKRSALGGLHHEYGLVKEAA
jgi:hypothetical protein